MTLAKSLAIGQLPMYGYFDSSIDLAGYGYNKEHYDHSKEFRSNCLDTWKLWGKILEDIIHKPKSVKK